MITRLLMCAITAIALSGCAALDASRENEAHARYKEFMDEHLGVRESALVNIYGIPDREYETSDAKYIEYVSSRNVPIPAPVPVGSRNMPMWGMYGGSATFFCKKTFKIVNHIVVQYRFNGNACKA